MTTRTQWPRSTPRLNRVTPEFSRLDQAAAINRIQTLFDSGFTEGEISVITKWSVIDVRRAIGDRP